MVVAQYHVLNGPLESVPGRRNILPLRPSVLGWLPRVGGAGYPEGGGWDHVPPPRHAVPYPKTIVPPWASPQGPPGRGWSSPSSLVWPNPESSCSHSGRPGSNQCKPRFRDCKESCDCVNNHGMAEGEAHCYNGKCYCRSVLKGNMKNMHLWKTFHWTHEYQ